MFEDEKKFENTQGTETPAAGTTPTPETANPAAGQSAGECFIPINKRKIGRAHV